MMVTHNQLGPEEMPKQLATPVSLSNYYLLYTLQAGGLTISCGTACIVVKESCHLILYNDFTFSIDARLRPSPSGKWEQFVTPSLGNPKT